MKKHGSKYIVDNAIYKTKFVRFVIFVYPKNNAILHLYFASYLSLTLSTRTIFHLDFIKHRNAGFDFLEKTGPWAPASFGVSGDW